MIYDEDYLKAENATAVSLTLPLTEEMYNSRTLFPFFDGLFPEGWLLNVVSRNWKIDVKDRFGLLLIACKDGIGKCEHFGGEEMNCFCCGKPLKTENEIGWHKACIKRFFGTTGIPDIEIDEEALEALATESTNKGLTVPGVQKKLSLHPHSEGGKPCLTLVNYPTGYILKPHVCEFEALPEAGDETAESGLTANILDNVERITTKTVTQLPHRGNCSGLFAGRNDRLLLRLTKKYFGLVFSASNLHFKSVVDFV